MADEMDTGEPIGEVVDENHIDPNEPEAAGEVEVREPEPAEPEDASGWPVSPDVETETVNENEPVEVTEEETPAEEEIEQPAPQSVAELNDRERQLVEQNLWLLRQLQSAQSGQPPMNPDQTVPGHAANAPAGLGPAPAQAELPPPITAQKIAEMFAADADDPAVKELAGAFTTLHGQLVNQGRRLDEVASWTQQEQASRAYASYEQQQWSGFLGTIAEEDRAEVEKLHDDLLRIGQQFNMNYPEALTYFEGVKHLEAQSPAKQNDRQTFTENLRRQQRNRTATVAAGRPRRGTVSTGRIRTFADAYRQAKAEGNGFNE